MLKEKNKKEEKTKNRYEGSAKQKFPFSFKIIPMCS